MGAIEWITFTLFTKKINNRNRTTVREEIHENPLPAVLPLRVSASQVGVLLDEGLHALEVASSAVVDNL